MPPLGSLSWSMCPPCWRERLSSAPSSSFPHSCPGTSGLFAAVPCQDQVTPSLRALPCPPGLLAWPRSLLTESSAWESPSRSASPAISPVPPQPALNLSPVCHIPVAPEHFHTSSLGSSFLCLAPLSVKLFCLIPNLNQLSRAEVISVFIE